MTGTGKKEERFLGIRHSRFKNKFFLATLFFVVWIVFFDENNLVERFQNIQDLKKLNADKEYYQEKIADDKERLKELKTNNDNLEKFAREQYLMKRDNEDVFVIVE